MITVLFYLKKKGSTWRPVANVRDSFVFDVEEGWAIAVNSDRYVAMLRNIMEPKFTNFANSGLLFQQDGATAHTRRRSMEFLRELFLGQWRWVAYLLSSLCDYFLRGYLKVEFWKYCPTAINELKSVVRQTITEKSLEITRRLMENFRNNLQLCIENRSYHL